LILLAAEVKIGDIIDADSHLGRIINLRTLLSYRKSDGVDVLVPNSYLLEKRHQLDPTSTPRYDFIIGVSYGVSTELS
jgi:small-conductance mechanosensitive channel